MASLSETRIGRSYRWWLGELSNMLKPRRSAARVWGIVLQRTRHGLDVLTSSASGTLNYTGTLTSEARDDQILALKRQIAGAKANSRQVLLRCRLMTSSSGPYRFRKPQAM